MDTLARMRALALMNELERSIEAFNHWWSERAVDSVVFPIALYPEGEVPVQIAVERESGTIASTMARQAYARLRRLDAQHPVTVTRLPGYVVVDEDPAEPVAHVNQAKSTLEHWIKTHWTKPATRTRACRRMFPGIIMHQVYRHIHPVGDDIGRISFLWSPSTVASKRLTLDAAITLIRDTQAEARSDNSEPPEYLDIAFEQVASLARGSNVQFVCRTPVAPHPRVALFEDGKSKAARTHHANLPLVLHRRTRERRIRELVSFDSRIRQRPRGRPQQHLTPVCPPLHLYAIDASR